MRVFRDRLPAVEEINETCETLEKVKRKIVVQLWKQNVAVEG